MTKKNPRIYFFLGNIWKENVEMLLFILVLLMYLLAVLGNLIIIALICVAPQLHTPMYFFLCNLAFQDIVYISAIQPKLMAITITGDHSISFPGCISQIFLFIFCLDTEFFLLTAMAYDRYVAICVPLRYSVIMNKSVCTLLAVTVWLLAGFNALVHSLLISNLFFCKSHELNHFFCELKTLLSLSCSDITANLIIIFVEGFFIGLFPFILIFTSYMFIISAVLKIRSPAGQIKAFSRCSSHLIVVILLYGTSLSFYMKPESEHSQEQDKILSMVYVAVVPVLNPLVYSLRNKEVLKALKKTGLNRKH
uniref:Olfactory receptor n=1 Tax=Xenopus tropicalis TaxID=8364 RepID=F6V3S0_XENTR